MSKINIDLDSHLEFVSEYDDNYINSKLVDYLLEQDLSDSIQIDVYFHYLNDDYNIDYVKKIFKRSFESCIKSVDYELKDSRLRCIYMLLLGVSSSIMYIWLTYLKIPVFSEFFLILCWISFGEIIEDFLFYRKKIINKKKKYERLLNAKIKIFLDDGDL